MDFKLKEIVTKIARENGLPFDVVKKILDAQFLCTRDIMREGVHDEPETFKNINLLKFGKIYAKKGVIEKMRKVKQDKKDRDGDKNI